MRNKWQQEVMGLLRGWLEAHIGPAEWVEQGDMTFLRLRPALFTDGSGQVLMEICLYDYGTDITVAQVYSTLLPTPGSGLDELRRHLPDWNFRSIAGSYGIYEKLGQLYHKQNIALIPQAMADDQADVLFTGICLAMDEMARRIGEAEQLSAQADAGGRP